MVSASFLSTLKVDCGLNMEKSILLGFSGGPDSLCLLYLLLESGARVHAAHLDHGLRESSASEADHAQQLCLELGVPCAVKRLDVAVYAASHQISIEESARLLRYQFLFEEAVRNHDQAVLVGHNANDQVETVLMHLLRGSGLSGLAGMRHILLPNPWSDVIPLVRPLLKYDREEIDQILQERGLQPVLDASNTDTIYFRNRIRKELLPILGTYNPQIRRRLINMAEVIAVEDDYLSNEVNKTWSVVIIEQGEKYLVFDRKKTSALHPALLRRVLRRAISWMDNTLRDIDFTVINRVAEFCKNPSQTNRVDLLAGIELFIYFKDRLVMAYESDPIHQLWPQITGIGDVEIPIPGELQLNGYWKITASTRSSYVPSTDRMIAQLDAKKLTGSTTIGRVKPGDRFAPYGYDGITKKVGDFWTGEGLPARARHNWPIVRSGGEIIWIPGFRIADSVKVDSTTTDIIRFELVKK